jgi:hypothetical protein
MIISYIFLNDAVRTSLIISVLGVLACLNR